MKLLNVQPLPTAKDAASLESTTEDILKRLREKTSSNVAPSNVAPPAPLVPINLPASSSQINKDSNPMPTISRPVERKSIVNAPVTSQTAYFFFGPGRFLRMSFLIPFHLRPVSTRLRNTPASPLHHNKQKLIDADHHKSGDHATSSHRDIMRFNRAGLKASFLLAKLTSSNRRPHSKKKKFTVDELKNFNESAEAAVKHVQETEGPRRNKTAFSLLTVMIVVAQSPSL